MTGTRALRGRGTVPVVDPFDRSAGDDDGAGLVLEHLLTLLPVVDALSVSADRIARWGAELADRMLGGARLLAAGNGGSAAEAQHLTAELVGRFEEDRPPFSAIALHSETSSITAIGNDFGFEQVFARQVAAHGRAGDVLVLLSTSGASPNLLAAARVARERGVRTWALAGALPNPLALLCDEAITLPGTSANVQEAQLVALHCLCQVFDAEVARRRSTVPGGEEDDRRRR